MMSFGAKTASIEAFKTNGNSVRQVLETTRPLCQGHPDVTKQNPNLIIKALGTLLPMNSMMRLSG